MDNSSLCSDSGCEITPLSLYAVIQDVDNSSLEGGSQSFASLMEQRLAELFMVAHQEGRRFKRAATVGSYTVQVRWRQDSPANIRGTQFKTIGTLMEGLSP